MVISSGHLAQKWLWSAINQFGSKALSMIGAVILVRFLEPEDFGIYALVSVPLIIGQHIIDGGLSQKILQKKKAEEIDYSTFFWTNLGASLCLLLILVAFGALIKGEYQSEAFYPVLVVSSFILLIYNLGKSCDLRLIRMSKFRELTNVGLTSTLLSILVGIPAAISGFGVWALVLQQGVNAIVNTLMLYSYTGWKAGGKFDANVMRGLYAEGAPLCVAQVFRSFANQLSTLMIGKSFTLAEVGFVNRGRLIPNHIMTATTVFMSRVNFSALSRVQSNREERERLFLEMVSKGVASAVLFTLPLIFYAETFVLKLLGERWLESAPYFRLGAWFIVVQVIWILIQDLLKSQALVQTVSVCSLVTSCFQVSGVLAGVPFGLWWIIAGDLVGRSIGCVMLFVCARNRGLLNIRTFWISGRRAFILSIPPALIYVMGFQLGNHCPNVFCIITTSYCGIMILSLQGFLPIIMKKLRNLSGLGHQ